VKQALGVAEKAKFFCFTFGRVLSFLSKAVFDGACCVCPMKGGVRWVVVVVLLLMMHEYRVYRVCVWGAVPGIFFVKLYGFSYLPFIWT
jgi:hypothetical protein